MASFAIFGSQETHGFSIETCEKMCSLNSWLCWVCRGFHGPEEYAESDENLLKMKQWLKTSPTRKELIQRGKTSHRNQKIVGGSPVKYGEEGPWTVR